jgi:two-component system, chemotaxis family, response regulator PixG
MVHSQLIISNKLLEEFQVCTQLQYSGKLDIRAENNFHCTFYYRLGRIVWATGGNHPFRRWRRNCKLYCPDVEIEKIQLTPDDISLDYWDYKLLESLHKNQKIKPEQINNFVDATIAELLFDIAQSSNFNSIHCQRNQDVILNEPMSLSSTNICLKQMQDSWESWIENGLANLSPDLAPVLKRPEELKEKVSETAYNNFLKLINGKYTLRDLAVIMKQNVQSVAQSLLSYILQGIIQLIEIPDFPLPIYNSNDNSKSNITQQKVPQINKTAPLIACVDDSPQICQMMENIITSQGMRFIAIQDPIQILATLIEQKPDLIFLDLVMPVATGYEICAQLRRVTFFAKTPIIILTSCDGLFDRVRAKTVGSTDFISKPVEMEKVIAAVHKHLDIHRSSQENSQSHFCFA